LRLRPNGFAELFGLDGALDSRPMVKCEIYSGACNVKLLEHLSDFFLVLGRGHSRTPPSSSFLKISNILCPPPLNRLQEIEAYCARHAFWSSAAQVRKDRLTLPAALFVLDFHGLREIGDANSYQAI